MAAAARSGQGGARAAVRLAPFPSPTKSVIRRCQRKAVRVLAETRRGRWKPVPSGSRSEYDPAGDKWTKKKNMQLPAHPSRSLRAAEDLVFGGAVQRHAGGPNSIPVKNSGVRPAPDEVLWRRCRSSASRPPRSGRRQNYVMAARQLSGREDQR